MNTVPRPLHAAVAGRDAASTAQRGDGISRADFLGLFGAVMLPMFLASIDQTLLATAVPAIGREFGGLADTSWVALGYLIAAAVTIPLYGRLGDRYGYRRLLAAALGVFLFGTLLGACAPCMSWLVAARVLQGLGGGGLMVLSQALIGERVAPRERARFQGWFAAVFLLSSMAGPVLGGWVVHLLGWRWLFWGLLPLAAFAIWRVLCLPQRDRPAAAVLPPTDATGAVLFAVAGVATLGWLSLAGQHFEWLSPASLALAAGALVAWALLLRQERRHPAAFLPVDVLRLPGMAALAATVVVFAGAMFALVFFLPTYLQLAHGSHAGHAGLLLLPLTLGTALGAVLTGRVVAHTGRAGDLVPYGLALAAAATAALALLPPTPWAIGTTTALCGLGFGSVMPNAQIVVQACAGRARLGAAAALVSLARVGGATLGTGLFAALVYNQLRGSGAGPNPIDALLASSPLDSAATVQAFHYSFGALAAALLCGAWLARRIPIIDLADQPPDRPPGAESQG